MASPAKFRIMKQPRGCLVFATYPHVSHLMIVEVGRGRECFSTHFTLVRFFSCVDPSVSVETGAGGELFTTEVTGVRPLSRVDPDVSLQ